MAKAKNKTVATTINKNHKKPVKKSYTAAHVVINTPELLDNILLRLPMKRLLFSQRVNKQFKATIDGSIKLQQALFFKVDPKNAKIFSDDGMYALFLKTGSRELAFETPKWSLKYFTIDCEVYNPNKARMRDDGYECHFHLRFKNLSDKPDDKQESWRKMHIFQDPAVCDPRVRVTPTERGYCHFTEEYQVQSMGTLGELFDGLWKQAMDAGHFDREARIDDYGEEYDEYDEEYEDEDDLYGGMDFFDFY
ncbi:hypothetical protein CLAFUW4_11934 [Fulvia fulva]|nr:hypothetical protein CLAFUR4_11939 [Fulvia fulva]WPV17974.1 hypothetical protein CLAFUW4_11934 [Fulvia fulva]